MFTATVMSETVVTWTAELCARRIVVVGVAHHADPVGDARHATLVGEGVPFLSGQDDAAVGDPLDEPALPC